jgi:hypothetical protein
LWGYIKKQQSYRERQEKTECKTNKDMSMKSTAFFSVLFILVSCIEQESFKPEGLDNSSTIFLNIKEMIDYAPEMVGPGVISTGNFEGHATVSPDGKEIYFAIYNNDHI